MTAVYDLPETLRKYMSTIIPDAGDAELLRAFAIAFIQMEFQNRMPIPEFLKLRSGIDFSSDKYVEERSSLYNGFRKDPFRFIRFGTPNAVKSFSEFKAVYNSCQFPLRHTELSIVLVIAIIESKEKNGKEAFDYAKDAVSQLGLNITLSFNDFQRMRNTVLFHQIINILYDRQKDKHAENAVRILKGHDENKSTRLSEYRSFFQGEFSSGIEADKHLADNFIPTQFSQTESRAGDTQGNAERHVDRFSRFSEMIEYMNQVDPVDLICADYRLKKENRKSKKTTNDYKSTDDPLILGIGFNVLSSMLSKVENGEYIVVFFPTPEFIRKWLDDDLLKGVKCIFVVESFQEAKLWQLQTGTLSEKDKNKWEADCKAEQYEAKKRTDTFFYSYQDYLGDANIREIPIALSFVFSSEIESKSISFTGQMQDSINEGMLGRDILCFGIDSSFKNSDSFFSSVNISEKYDVESVMFLPDKLDIANPKRKHLLYARRRDSVQESTRMIRWRNESIFEDNHHKYIEEKWCFKKETTGPIVSSDIGRKSFRTYIESEYEQSKRKEVVTGSHSGKRQTREPIEFLPGILIHYSFSKLDNGKINIHAYITDGKAEVKESGADATLNDESEIDGWLRNGYPYKIVEGRKVKEEPKRVFIHDVISENLKPVFRGKPICLRTFLFLHLDEICTKVKDKVKNKSEDAIRMFVFFSESEEYGNSDIRSLRLENLVDYLNANGHDADDVVIAMRAFDVALEIAKREKNVEFNYVRVFFDSEDRRRKAMANVRSKLAVKSLTREQMCEITGFVRKRILEGEPIYAGVMIKLFTGLETRAVCALQWEDFCDVPLYGYHQLQIYKSLSDKAKKETSDDYDPSVENDTSSKKEYKPEPFDDYKQYRCIPCAETLVSALKTAKEQLEKKGLFRSKNPIAPESFSTVEEYPKPVKLLEAVRTAVKSLGIKGLEVSLDDDTTTDLSVYKGDFLHSNFRYFAQDVAKMNNDDIAYIFANEPDTVFAAHYCDYARDSSQMALYTKLRRIDALFASGKKGRPATDKGFDVSEGWSDIPPKGSGLQKLTLSAPVDRDRDYEIEVKANYGVHLVVDGENI